MKVVIKDKPNLVRDTDSKVLVNMDSLPFQQYEQQKKLFNNAKTQMEEISNLRSEVDDMKILLGKILEKLTDK